MNPENIRRILQKGNLKLNEPMSRHTTFRTGGPAKLFAEPFTEKELAALVRYLKNNKIPYTVIGNGSNLLISDQGYDGVIIHLGRVDGSEFVMLGYEEAGDRILFDAGCGCLMSVLGTIAENFGCTGFEPLSGIPGCIGGAVSMNAGAYGTEIGKLVREIRAVKETGEIVSLDISELNFSYRTSSVTDKKMIVTRVNYILSMGDRDEIASKMKEYSSRRKEKQPLEYPSAGSAFKRPAGYFAGKLIEDSGLKGYSIGGACVSDKHAGFIINKENATSEDIFRLIRFVQKTVKEKTGIMLEPEIKMIGEFKDEQ